MRILTKPFLWAVTLPALFSVPNLALAYYDPGVQRWINRDPLRDPALTVRQPPQGLAPYLNNKSNPFVAKAYNRILLGSGVNYYEFTGNNLICTIDPYGLRVVNIPIYEPCPTPFGGLYLCYGTVPVTPAKCRTKDLIPCVTACQTAIILGCLLSDFELFSDGCHGLETCFKAFWN